MLKVFHNIDRSSELNNFFEVHLNIDINFWESIKQSLRAKNIGNKLIQTWFDPTELITVEKTDHGNRFKLGVPTELHKYWITENFFDRICSEISAQHKNPFQLEFVVTGKKQNDQKQLQFDYDSTSAPLIRQPQVNPAPSQSFSLNRDYTFSSFVVGRTNEFAHASSFNIAQNPGAEGYNPLFICGPTGMGKTHLLNAVGNHIRSAYPDLRICYLSA